MEDNQKENWVVIVEEALATGETIQVCTENDDGNVVWCLIEPDKHLCTKMDEPVSGIRAFPPDALS